jgi:uncharacterized membrane protein YiaA
VVRRALLILALVALMAGTIVFALVLWTRLDGVEMSTNGYVALAIGAIVASLVGSGLMALVFFSSRKGYDDRV